MSETPYLVPLRECGSCTACCSELAITADGMEKLPGVACQHCEGGGGCAIYDARPQVCRDYHCLWRSMAHMDESWRPDRSGILIAIAEVPPGMPARHAVEIMLVGPEKSLETKAFAGMIGGFIESGTACFLNILPAPGYFARHMLLNDVLAPAIAARNLGKVRRLIRLCYLKLKAQQRVAITDADMARSRQPGGWKPDAAMQ